MNKFRMSMEKEKNPLSIVSEPNFETTTFFQGDSLNDVLKSVEKFLKGCGYDLKGELRDVINPVPYGNENPNKTSCKGSCQNSLCSSCNGKEKEREENRRLITEWYNKMFEGVE